MVVNICGAKTKLWALLDKAVAGEEIIIARAGKPLARLMPLTSVAYKSGVRLGGFSRANDRRRSIGRVIAGCEWMKWLPNAPALNGLNKFKSCCQTQPRHSAPPYSRHKASSSSSGATFTSAAKPCRARLRQPRPRETRSRQAALKISA